MKALAWIIGGGLYLVLLVATWAICAAGGKADDWIEALKARGR